VAHWWERNIVEPGKLPLLLCFVAFIATFITTRAITRSIRAGRGPFRDVEAGDVHIHHAVPGIILLLVGAIIAISARPVTPWRELGAVLIGIGASLVLDEFALILRLSDVYWTQEGRLSVQAVALVTVCLACVLIGLSPFGVDDLERGEFGVRWAGLIAVLAAIVSAALCVLKGKYRLALVAIFLPPVSYVGALRLARPGSIWDRRRYLDHPTRHEQAVERARAFDARWDPGFRWLGNLVAGGPHSS
jgi:hypothetical protein